MTPETRRTIAKVLGILGLMFGTVALVYMLAPQLIGTVFRQGVIVVMATIGLAFLIVKSIKAIV